MTSSELLAVIGDPVAHSLSPRLQTAAIASAGLGVRYVAMRVPAERLAGFVANARMGELRGFNVTIPHKEAVVSLLDALERPAAELGAVNTVVRAGSRLVGHNTDVLGFRRALERVSAARPRRALVLGAGGAARAAAYALRELGSEVAISARRPDQADRLSRVVQGVQTVPWDSRSVCAEGCDLIVNATPLGMSHLADESPLSQWPRARDVGVAFDLVYGHDTPFLRGAVMAGWTRVDGLEMLVQQGAEAFRLWFGLEADLDAMRCACTEEVSCSAS